MVRKKGIGYIIEAFVSSLVIVIFVLGSYSTLTTDNQQDDFEDQIMAEDTSLTLQKTGYTQEMIENGDTDMLARLSSELTAGTRNTGISIRGPPVGSYSLGIYTIPDRTLNSSVESITPDDRCHGDLNETGSEFPPLHTNSSSDIEQAHGLRIYLADRDSQEAEVSRYNGDLDYDSFYIDTDERCQFSDSEGPFPFGEHVTIENNTVETYQINDVDDKNLYYYRTPLAKDIQDLMAGYETVRVDINNLNFSDDYENQDLIIFPGNATLKHISDHKDRFNGYAKQNPVILAMNLNHSTVSTGALWNTGLGWINLTKTPSADRKPGFNPNRESQRIKNYLDDLGYTSDQIKLSTGGNVTSRSSGAIENRPLVSSANYRFETAGWDHENTSMEEVSDVPTKLEELTGCGDAHREGTFIFPGEDSEEKKTVYSTKLDGRKIDCGDLFGISVDKDDDGEIESSETTFLKGDRITVNGREYTITVNSHGSVRFEYTGNDRVEYLALRESFEDREVKGLGRLPRITSESPNSHIALLMASSLYLMEGERSSGTTEGEKEYSTTIPVITEKGVYTVSTRWFE